MAEKKSIVCTAVLLLIAALAMGVGIVSCRQPDSVSPSSFAEALAGGSQTVFDQTGQAFSHEFPNMSTEESR
ncbi:MAG TPA: hypothetical protein VGM92_12705, partial [Candidatus Kapabacteria bacterium]